MKDTIVLLMGGSALALLGFMACGGNVVVDPPGDGGMGGTSPTTSSGMSGNGGAGASCPVPAPVGAVIDCGGTATVGSGEPPQCGTVFCDQANNTYTVLCGPTACTCQHNADVLCSCSIEGPGDICAGTAEDCCPFPFAH